ncbi:MAG TPA: hypothetical protein VGB37_10015 [Candidatus Lokiarchaeia archaeon]
MKTQDIFDNDVDCLLWVIVAICAAIVGFVILDKGVFVILNYFNLKVFWVFRYVIDIMIVISAWCSLSEMEI